MTYQDTVVEELKKHPLGMRANEVADKCYHGGSAASGSSSTHLALKKLCDKGLVEKVVDGKVKTYKVTEAGASHSAEQETAPSSEAAPVKQKRAYNRKVPKNRIKAHLNGANSNGNGTGKSAGRRQKSTSDSNVKEAEMTPFELWWRTGSAFAIVDAFGLHFAEEALDSLAKVKSHLQLCFNAGMISAGR